VGVLEKKIGSIAARASSQPGNLNLETRLEARDGIEPTIKVLQTFALPLGDRALSRKKTARLHPSLKIIPPSWSTETALTVLCGSCTIT
jgi:hypothetical protein